MTCFFAGGFSISFSTLVISCNALPLVILVVIVIFTSNFQLQWISEEDVISSSNGAGNKEQDLKTAKKKSNANQQI
jgi:hypothetical protein